MTINGVELDYLDDGAAVFNDAVLAFVGAR